MKLSVRYLAVAVLLLVSSAYVGNAEAVPSFARQTGWDCTQCHLSWLELTNIGRRFKLGGYQIMKNMEEGEVRPLISLRFEDPPPLIPLAFWIQFADTHTANVNTPGTGGSHGGFFPQNNEPYIQAATVFLNGKLAEHVGCFCQWTYDGLAQRFSADNEEVRIANEYNGDNFRALYGVAINNNPGMSDIYNSTWVWGWPYLTSAVGIAPSAGTLLGTAALAQSAAGMTAYTMINNTLYLEGGAYHYSDHGLQIFRINTDTPQATMLKGFAPYYRVALQHDWSKGRNSAEIGAYGLTADKYPSGYTSGMTDHYVDQGFDGQYQYITDKHRFSYQVTYLNEKQTLSATEALGLSTNVNNTVNQFATKFSYYYNKWYGVNVGYQRTTGTTDLGLYNAGAAVNSTAGAVFGSLNGNPDTEAVIGELDYLFSIYGSQTRRKERLILQYTAYQKFNGATNNYDGTGRKASDNNFLYLALWSVF
jgi:hypothetical protein